MKKFIRIIALAMSLCLILVFSGCNKSDSSDSSNTSSNSDSNAALILPYSREDGVNPYAASSLVNQAVMPLLYESLYSVDENYDPVAEIAGDTTVTGTSAVVRIASGKQFSDGTSVSADDVVYSFNLAKSSSYYSSALTTVKSASVLDNGNVEFTLTASNKYISAILTFPIVKSDTAADSESIPVGSGRYTYKATSSGGTLSLNENYDGKTENEEIELYNVTDSSSLLYSLAVDNVSAVFDDISDGSIERVTVSMVQAPLNNILFVGFGSKATTLSDASLRNALSSVLDRTKLLSSGVDGYGDASELPFNPSWYASDGVEFPSAKKTEAEQLISEQLDGKTLTIVTCSDNPYKVNTASALATQLEDYGITCTVTELEYDSYTSAISSGWCDLYIGEMKLTNDMNISGLISDDDLSETYAEMRAGNVSVSSFIESFSEVMPFITIGFRNGIVAYARSSDYDINPLPGNPFANIYEW